jgi:prepilin peptidase CpaA
MFGAIDPVAASILALSGIAIATDLFKGRIYNWLTVSAMILGLILGFVASGWMGILQALVGIGIGLLLYGWIFWLGFMGAGDVKLLMALGALGGIHYVEEVALLGILCGGVMSVLVLLIRGRLFQFLKKIYYFLLSVFVSQLELQVPKIDRKVTMPFGVAISAAAVWAYFGHPLVRWGLILWP